MIGCPTWDCGQGPSTAPDPYVVERTLAVRTGTLQDTITPPWEETLAVGLTTETLSQPLRFDVYDHDSEFDDDLIASFRVTLTPEQRQPGRITLTAPVGSMTATLVLELR